MKKDKLEKLIEQQEKNGQIEQTFKDTLPKEGTSTKEQREKWEKLGFKFHNDYNDLFVYATFPKGWRKRPSYHSMWTYIIDDKGKERASIFYKAAFYDRHAFVSLDD